MTKQDIISRLEERTNLSLHQAKQAVEGIIDIITEALTNDEVILLRGFASIKTVQRAERPVRDIRKGTTMMLPARKQVKFIAYNELKEKINNNGHHAILP